MSLKKLHYFNGKDILFQKESKQFRGMFCFFWLLSSAITRKPATIYFTRSISSDAIIRLYNLLDQPLKGKVAVKISTGERGGNNYLHPELIGDFVKLVKGTIVECNTFYQAARSTSQSHWQVIREHGFPEIAECDIMDEEGEIGIPVPKGKHMKEFVVGTHALNYSSYAILSHFKGHAMGGFGGALKNIAIGVGSVRGKGIVHTAGNLNPTWDIMLQTPQIDFLETMAEAVSGFVNKFKAENIVYINVAYNLSIDCDCDGNPAPPELADIGIFASLDPIAIDQACVDAVYNSPDTGKASLIHRMEQQLAVRILEYGEELGLGSRKYEIIDID